MRCEDMQNKITEESVKKYCIITQQQYTIYIQFSKKKMDVKQFHSTGTPPIDHTEIKVDIAPVMKSELLHAGGEHSTEEIILMVDNKSSGSGGSPQKKVDDGLLRKEKIMDYLHQNRDSLQYHPENIVIEKEIKVIQEAVNAHRQTQKFIMAFSQHPEQAIKQAIARNELKNDPQSIAAYLLQFSAISKVALGGYFSKNKKDILEVLKYYCRLLNFLNMQFDKALRTLLAKFKLMGESQQIQRILQIFANVYYETHQSEFSNANEIYVFSYSVMMLATDAHNPQQKTKMTKAQFLKNTAPVCPKISLQYLDSMYDRIVKEAFATEYSISEKTYERILNLNRIEKSIQIDQELITGHIFIKYCRSRPKSVQRKLHLSEKMDKLLWEDPNNQYYEPRFICLQDIIDLNLGCGSPVMILNKVPKQFDSMCFSIVTKDRTLDVKARDPQNRARWIRFIFTVLIKKREDLRVERENYYNRHFNKQKIEQIWNTDIFPHWDHHWDYNKKKPKQKKYQNFFKLLRKLCFCGSNKNQVYEVQEGKYQSLLPIKTPLLQTLWKYGLPESSRKTLWPIIIGNELGITKKLYGIYANQKKEFQNIQKLPFSRQAVYLVQLLAIIRPDIDLVRNLLEIATVFLKYLSEYDSFCALANMMHHYHFLTFYQGERQEIQFRINFFDYLLKTKLTAVFQHLHGLELYARLYLINWFVSIFSCCFQGNFLARIWDNFFIEGEVYLFKVGFTIIKYYEIELKMSNFDECMKILSKPIDTSQILFFEMINQFSISKEEFQDFIQKRSNAIIKTKVQEIPLGQ